MVRSRQDQVDDLIDKNTKELQGVVQKVRDCGCQVDCSMHLYALSLVELTTELMNKIDEVYMQTIDAKLYTTDVGMLMRDIEKFAEHKVKEKMFELNMQSRKSNPRHTEKSLYTPIGEANGSNRNDSYT
jgi:predicted nucleotide-binding protein (sugar kinase/HSP70/actin superfamily)